MKKWKSLLLIGAVCTMCVLPVHGAEANFSPADPVHTEASVIMQEAFGLQKSEVKNGWFKEKGGKRYYDNGKYVKGLYRIKDRYYYFDEKNGVMCTGWKTLGSKNKTFYFDKKTGVKRIGYTKIDGKYYFLTKSGALKKGNVTDGKTTYYTDGNGVVEMKKVGGTYYTPRGKVMTKTQVYEYETLLRARKIVAEQTNSAMSKSQKLEKCFRWVMAKHYKTVRPFTKPDGWIALYANDHFIDGRGNCFSDACAFGYLAKALGYEDVYVCIDSKKTDGTGGGHSWTEINGLVYDPLFAQAKSFSGNYGVRYGVYKLYPLIKEKV